MKKIQVEALSETMILARDVCGPSGNVLLSAGVKLNPSMGRRLKNWGIHFVNVESEDDPALAQGTPRISSEELQKSLTHRFSAVMNNLLMKKIFDAVLAYKIQKGAV
jgi:hypothetical protein